MSGLHSTVSAARKIVLCCACIISFAGMSLAAVPAFAASIDYLAANISPSADFNGASGNFTLKNNVAGGDAITFDLTFQINTAGSSTSYPRTITFGVTDITKPAGASDPTVTGLTSHTFTTSSSSFTDSITITAPSTPGAYTVHIFPTGGTGGQNGLAPGGGITIGFTVNDNACVAADTSLALTLADPCLLYHTASTSFTATLTSGGSAVPGENIDFTVDSVSIGSATTGADGKATITYDPSGLAVGDHTVVASFQGGTCSYNASENSATLGIHYMFLGFQQPINADGTSLFGGRTIPVKVRIADADGQPVPDADAHAFFAFGTPAIVGTDTEPLANTNGDTGNTMRYDASANQYIFNWDIANLPNGTYTIRVGLSEGTCADSHTVVVTLKKKGSK
jgi:hypothetical protein